MLPAVMLAVAGLIDTLCGVWFTVTFTLLVTEYPSGSLIVTLKL